VFAKMLPIIIFQVAIFSLQNIYGLKIPWPKKKK